MQRLTCFALVLPALFGITTRAEADVLCKGKHTALLKLRPACKAFEDQLPIAIEDGGKTVVVTGANLKVVSGSGATSGPTNGLGNLIVGYDEDVAGSPRNRSGSHNLVVGPEHSYSSYGGLVAGRGNTVSAPNASVSGGLQNSATSEEASVSGGACNYVGLDPPPPCDVVGFNGSQAGSVGGGFKNVEQGVASSIAGGTGNQIIGPFASVLGGRQNIVVGLASSISGGLKNRASGDSTSVTGGYCNVAGPGSPPLNCAFDLEEDPDPNGSLGATISGGRENRATGIGAAVSGGGNNQAWARGDSVSGGRFGDASGDFASVAGGFSNAAGGGFSAILGGIDNGAAGYLTTIAGGQENVAQGGVPDFTPGGSVCGGFRNTASGNLSVVSGGANRTASGDSDWVAGSLFEDN